MPPHHISCQWVITLSAPACLRLGSLVKFQLCRASHPPYPSFAWRTEIPILRNNCEVSLKALRDTDEDDEEVTIVNVQMPPDKSSRPSLRRAEFTRGLPRWAQIVVALTAGVAALAYTAAQLLSALK